MLLHVKRTCVGEHRKTAFMKKFSIFLHVFRRGRSSNDLNQFTSNDSLAGAIEKDLESVDHIAGVL